MKRILAGLIALVFFLQPVAEAVSVSFENQGNFRKGFMVPSVINFKLGSTTWYVRDGGGTATQCTGTTNAVYPGTGSAQACAFNHPAWALGTNGKAGVMVGGDTLMIAHVSDVHPGQQAQYVIGYLMPNVSTGQCNAAAPYNCFLGAPPSGTASNYTKIYGDNFASATGLPMGSLAQLYGDNAAMEVFNFGSAGFVDVEGLEFTTHFACSFRMGANICPESYESGGSTYNGAWARNGVAGSNVSNLIMQNLYIHGFPNRNILMGGITNMTLNHVFINGGALAGWDFDVFSESGNDATGTLTVNDVHTRFAGCIEKFPVSPTFNTADYSGCTDENASGYGDGWGFATAQNGTWFITNSEWSHNTQDGFDSLHWGSNANNKLYIDKSLFEGNGGNQLKFNASVVEVDNSVFVANCDYLKNAGKVFNSSWINCRANGTPISAVTSLGASWTFQNDTALTSTGPIGSAFIETVSDGTANGTETYKYSNNVLDNPNNTWIAMYPTLSGAALTAWNSAQIDHSDIYNFKNQPGNPSNVYTNPNWGGTYSDTADSNVPNTVLTLTSPGKGTGTSANTFWNTNLDYNGHVQNSPVDMGAQQYFNPTLSPNNATCLISSQCASGNCCFNVCTTPICQALPSASTNNGTLNGNMGS